MRLIDADRFEDTWNQFKTMVDNVDAQPTVDPVKYGYWIRVDWEDADAFGWRYIYVLDAGKRV